MAYIRPVSKTTWYLAKRSYTIHMVQEITSLFVAIFSLVILCGFAAVAGGPESYKAFLDALASPAMRTLTWIITIVMCYHAIAWFSVTPKAMPIQIGEDFIPGNVIAGAHYVVWFALSVIVLVFAGVL